MKIGLLENTVVQVILALLVCILAGSYILQSDCDCDEAAATMKAIIAEKPGDADVLKLRDDVSLPVIERGIDMLVKVHATAVNRADTLQRQGKYPPPKGESDIIGLEVAGVVHEIGSDVKKFKVGDKIMALVGGGGYAEYCLVNSEHAMAIPDGLSFTQAAAVPEAFLTAFQSLEYGRLFEKSDEEASKRHILLHAGGSSVSIAAVQLAKLVHTEEAPVEVIVTASEGKLARCKELGATHAFNRHEKWYDEVRAATDGRGVDILIDYVGGPYFQHNIDAMALDSTMIMLGFLGGSTTPEPINLAALLRKRIHLQGSTLRTRSHAYKKALVSRLEAFASAALADGRIQTLVDRVFPLTEAADAHKYMEANKNFGKIVLQVI